jgi:hypothetical protein
MLVQRNTQKLGDDIDAIDAAVQAVADGNINQPILRSQRDRRLGSNLGQWIKSRSSTTAENQRYDLLHVG